MNKLLTASAILILLTVFNSKVTAQANVLDPADPNVIFTASNQPTPPAWNNYNIVKWGHTNRLGWNPYNYGYKSYIYQGMAFRLKFPKTYVHNVADNKKYPLFIFFHGRGESGSIYDNEYQLLHGGQLHAQKVDDGTFDGFLFYAQSTTGNSQDYLGRIMNLVDSMAKHVKVDIDRVIVSGLSAGGAAAWDVLSNNTWNKKVTASLPISAAATGTVNSFPNYITVPIWLSNGGQDLSPAPFTVDYLITSYRNLGGKMEQTYFPSQGHGVWNSFWQTPGYFQYLGAQHKANPLIYFQRHEFCPNEAVNARLGVNPGFNAYEWQKSTAGGPFVTIAGATTSQLIVNSYGTYRVRFRRTASSAWSDWSPTPAVISEKQGTVSPPIAINGMRSNVLPAPDGSVTVPLIVPNTFASYEWRRVSDNALVSSTNTYVAPVGQYKIKVTEQFGCSSNFSDNYTVINANGTNVPDKVSNLSAIAPGNSSVQLDWNDNPSPQFNETQFEIYRSTTPGSNYKLVAKINADILTHLDTDLASNTTYYYVIRAINNNGASLLSSEVSVTTKSDIIKPTAPANLRVVFASPNTVTLAWDASTDDVGIDKYEVYINGVKAFVTKNLEFTVPGLTYMQLYSFIVKAKDPSGNLSPASNQVTAHAKLSGLSYKYYEGEWNSLPDFNTLVPDATGNVTNVTLTPRLRNDNFGFLWEGYIKIPATGSYTFETNSDDGSKLYIGKYNNASTALVNNDGLHGGQYRSGTITLTQGIHPIAITFFEQGGGESMNIYWRSSAAGINSRQAIPNSAFNETINIPASSLPAAPSNFNVLASSYNKINLSWNDNSNNETGFEITRSTSQFGVFVPVGTTAANVTTYIDSVGLEASTKYWYEIRAINNSGGSATVSDVGAKWSMNNNYLNETGTGLTLTTSGSPSFNTDRAEGSHSLSFNGSNAYATIPNSSSTFPANTYGTRTVALWVKPNASTISSSNRIIIDLGDEDDGMALRFNSGSLQAGIARNGSNHTAVANNITSNANWVSGGWNHVAAVYNGTTIKLFVNSVELASTNLSSTGNIVESTSNGSRIAATNSDNAFNSSTSNTNYGGLIDDVVIVTEPLTSASLNALMRQAYAADTTHALPPVPTIPGGIAASPLSTSKVNITWNDNSNNETGFEIYRAVGTPGLFRPIAFIAPGAGGQMAYIDSNLFANTNYYYNIRATGIGGNSAFTSNALARTFNNKPVISDVSNFSLRYGSVKNIVVTATDADVETLTMTVLNQPFGTFTPGNGTATLMLNPTVAQQGVYNMSVIATDGNGGADTTTFTITVNSNYQPVIAAVTNKVVNEGTGYNFQVTATDQDGNASLVWSLVTPQPFASFTGTVNGVGTLNVNPTYAHAGVYNMVAKVIDGAGGESTVAFTITVNNVEPTAESIFMNMRYTGAAAPAPWNNITGTTTNNLVNSGGQVTPVTLNFIGTPWNGGDAGYITGNNSGVYPDAVIRDYFWFGNYGAPESVNVEIGGLAAGENYSLTLFASSGWFGVPDNGTTVYTINGEARPLYAHNNNQNTANFGAVVANASGKIVIEMTKGAGAPYGMVNAIVLQKTFDDGTSPILPTNLTAQALNNGTVKLSWNDVAYNEDRYTVYRSLSAAGPFTILNPGASNANDSTYIDNSVSSSTTYYYKIEALNGNGTSGQSGVVNATTGNKAPVLANVANGIVKTGDATSINITATDDPGDVLTINVTGLPSFATFNSTGNGTGNIAINPGVNDVGVFTDVIVKVTDNLGASSSDTIKITVIDNTIRSVFINFSNGSNEAAPWNNFGYPYANVPLSNLRDDADVATPFSIRLQQQWDGSFALGMATAENSGIFPDNVLRSSIFTASSATRNIQIDGLDPAKRYNVVFFSSHNAGQSAIATFANGAQSVILESRYNTTTSAQLNGLTPNASGSIVVNATKNAGAAYLNLNAMIIEEYLPATPILRPFYLIAETILETNRIQLTWADRSNNETGFQIYRSTSVNGTYSLVTTTAANVKTFTDNNLTPNTRYFYRVRAVNGGTNSNYSNLASVVLSTRVVFVNMNAQPAQNAGIPWNNTTSPPLAGAKFSNLMDNTQANSGVEMEITEGFSGPGFLGVSGAGIFPSGVMESNFWNDAGQLSQFKFSNLDIRKKYRIGVFGSAIFVGGYSIANYTCNGKTVQLNSLYNNSKVVYLDNLEVSEDGNLILNVTTAAGSAYCFTGAITIESYDDVTPYTPVEFTRTGEPVVQQAVYEEAATKPLEESKVKTEIASKDINVYPNPFNSKINVELTLDKAADVSLTLYDLQGRLIYKTTETDKIAGRNKISMDLPASVSILPGSYTIVVSVNGKVEKSVKLIKVN